MTFGPYRPMSCWRIWVSSMSSPGWSGGEVRRISPISSSRAVIIIDAVRCPGSGRGSRPGRAPSLPAGRTRPELELEHVPVRRTPVLAPRLLRPAATDPLHGRVAVALPKRSTARSAVEGDRRPCSSAQARPADDLAGRPGHQLEQPPLVGPEVEPDQAIVVEPVQGDQREPAEGNCVDVHRLGIDRRLAGRSPAGPGTRPSPSGRPIRPPSSHREDGRPRSRSTFAGPPTCSGERPPR